MNNSPLTVGFIGLGLIGGSMAKAIKKAHPEYTLIASSRSLPPLQAAKDEGVIDIITEDVSTYFDKCDFIFLCTPVVTISKYFTQLKNIIKSDCILTDVGSVKGNVHKAAVATGLERNFIGGHPMAGNETCGYSNSTEKFLLGAKYIITKSEYTTELQLAMYENLIKDIGAIPVVMDPELHDKTAAVISHVPHLVAAALAKIAKDNEDPNQFMHTLAAGGFKDTTRIAASTPEMWSQICKANSEAICAMLENYIDRLNIVLDSIKNNTEEDGVSYIAELFTETREYRNTF
ncbi:MAG: prephenate dehydrogenase/arogenate dehydrogenase family protein [Lachnospira sp.]|nr:prephenate dehydrogenase/arogenate dehydrogenase family protein [Lachnospira sp.]